MSNEQIMAYFFPKDATSIGQKEEYEETKILLNDKTARQELINMIKRGD